MPIQSSLGALRTIKQLQSIYGGSRYFGTTPGAGEPVGFRYNLPLADKALREINKVPGYTLEYRVRYTSLANGSGPQYIGSLDSGFGFDWIIGVDSSGRLEFRISGGGRYRTAIIISTNVWYSIAVSVVNDGTNSTFYFFVNGTLRATQDISIVGEPFRNTQVVLSSSIPTTKNRFSFAPSNQTPSQTLNYDEVRVSNIARYTANYAVSNTEFDDDANTLLLLHFYYDITLPDTAPIIDSSSYNRVSQLLGNAYEPIQVQTPKVF